MRDYLYYSRLTLKTVFIYNVHIYENYIGIPDGNGVILEIGTAVGAPFPSL